MAFRNSVTPRVGPFAFWTSPDNGRHLNPAGTKLIEEYLEQYPNPSTLVNLKYPSFKRVADDILGRDEVRSVWQFYRDRRPDAYGPLVQP